MTYTAAIPAISAKKDGQFQAGIDGNIAQYYFRHHKDSTKVLVPRNTNKKNSFGLQLNYLGNFRFEGLTSYKRFMLEYGTELFESAFESIHTLYTGLPLARKPGNVGKLVYLLNASKQQQISQHCDMFYQADLNMAQQSDLVVLNDRGQLTSEMADACKRYKLINNKVLSPSHVKYIKSMAKQSTCLFWPEVYRQYVTIMSKQLPEDLPEGTNFLWLDPLRTAYNQQNVQPNVQVKHLTKEQYCYCLLHKFNKVLSYGQEQVYHPAISEAEFFGAELVIY